MKSPGYLIKTKEGKKGRTYHGKGLINGKIPVYLEIGKFSFSDKGILCNEDSLTVIGFID